MFTDHKINMFARNSKESYDFGDDSKNLNENSNTKKRQTLKSIPSKGMGFKLQ